MMLYPMQRWLTLCFITVSSLADRHALYPVKSHKNDTMSPPTAHIRNIVIPKGDYKYKIQRRIDETDIERKLLPEEAVEDSGSLERQVLANYGRIVETMKLIRNQRGSVRSRLNYVQNSLKNQGPIIIDTFAEESIASNKGTIFDLPKAHSSVKVGKVIRIAASEELDKSQDIMGANKHSWQKTKTIKQAPLRRGQRFKTPIDIERKRYQEPAATEKEELKSKASFKEIAISRSPPPSRGVPWPLPRWFVSAADIVFLLTDQQFSFVLSERSVSCDLIEKAVDRSYRSIFAKSGHLLQKITPSDTFFSTTGQGTFLRQLELHVGIPCAMYPSLEANESYSLIITENGARLTAPEVWGALHGLQSFSQLIYAASPGEQLMINRTEIKDYPRFPHRGILLDTARHYLSVDIIKRNLDAMSLNKFNVFHWHIVDDQSFPFQSQVFPDLSKKGAFSASEIYTLGDIADIIEYARLRGIRVIPEFDTPGHTQSWGAGHPELFSRCGKQKKFGPIDPSKNATYTFLNDLFQEVMAVFPDEFLHLGGDECSYFCWSKNINITNFMFKMGFEKDFSTLDQYYINRLTGILRNVDQRKKHIFWEEILDGNKTVSNDSIIQVWKPPGWQSLVNSTRRGYRVIYSSQWYLNYQKYGSSWKEYYRIDPSEAIDADKKHLLLGGEACMWGEYIDDSNLLSTLWPGASAVAERLWSDTGVGAASKVDRRIEEQRCRMVRHGIPAAPTGGPGSCRG